MAEELVLDVKTNFGKATKDTKEYTKSLEQVNEEINLQTKYIIAQEKELIRLKAKQDAIPKGAFYAGMNELNKKIRETTADIKDEKNGLKSLKQEQKEATQALKKSTVAKKEDNTVSKESVANFQFMGVSLNGIKKGFSQIIPTAKAMFGTIKAGIMSTGIGALVLAVVALTQSFKRSEEGQEKFQRIMAAIGAVTSQVLDLFAGLGGAIISAFEDPKKAILDFKDFIVENITNRFNAALDTVGFLGSAIKKVFSGDIAGAMDDAKNAGSSYVDILTGVEDTIGKVTEATKELVAETSKEVDALIAVTKARQKAHHIDRELKVERAKANREINDIRLQAEDREKNNATERIALLRKAQAIEEGITAKEIKSKKILIEAQKLEMAQGLNTIEAKDKLAQLQAELINLDTKKLRSQRLLQTQITTAVNQEKAEKEAKIAEEKAAREKIEKDAEDARLKKIADDEKAAKEEIRIAKEVADAKAGIRDANISNIKSGIAIVKSLAGDNKDLQAASIIAENAVGVAKTIINTQAANAAATLKYAALPGGIALATAEKAANNISAGISIAASVAAAAQGLAALGTGGAAGGNNANIPSSSSAPPSPQMMSGAFQLEGGQEVEPARAYVVSDDITDSQNGLAIIRRRATI